MADLRTTVTELVTGLGTTGFENLEAALSARPSSMASVSPEQWALLHRAYEGGALATEFVAAFANGQAFLHARDGLRGRVPVLIEWKGAQANPGDNALPVDLRIDHVFLISCKYLSKIVHNAAPSRVFDQLLRSASATRTVDWYDEVAAAEHQQLYEASVAHCQAPHMPAKVTELTRADRLAIKERTPKEWGDQVEVHYRALCARVAAESARRWNEGLNTKAEQEAMLWRLLRFGPAPYFVLGASKAESLRMRIATPWDWRQEYTLQKLSVQPKSGGQPMVGWLAEVKERHSGSLAQVAGHVEVRWSHGRFGGFPEAKVYLDTPHEHIPGYFSLD